MRKAPLLSVICFLILSNAGKAREYRPELSQKEVLSYLRGKKKSNTALKAKNIKKDHPDFIVSSALLALRKDQLGQPKGVVELLEPLLPYVKYSGLKGGLKKKHSNLLVGPVGSFHFWRELVYLLLGRAYYQQGQFDFSSEYFSGVPRESPFFLLSNIGRTWVHLKLDEKNKVEETIASSRKSWKRLNSSEKNEVELQSALLSLESGEYREAIEKSEKLSFSSDHERELSAIKYKILGQSSVEIFVSNARNMTLAEKKDALSRAISYLEKVSSSYRNPGFAYFTAETYWQLASTLRIADPVKNKNEVRRALASAEAWLEPWIGQSIRTGKSVFDESAFFFFATVLWEGDKKKKAVPVLLAMDKLFPQGKYREDRYQLLADFFYESGNFESAVTFYTKLANIGTLKKAAYGVYKAAWAFYNQGEKWKALRHLQRLFLHYRKDRLEEKDLSENLLKETQKDMILLMAELLSSSEAQTEFALYALEEGEEIVLQEQLGRVYKKIGRYKESISIWEILLGRVSKDLSLSEKGVGWLNELLNTLLRAGKRRPLAQTIDRYFPKVSSALKIDGEAYKQLEKNIVAIILTVHREARKTDDRDIWASTDLLYQSYFKHFPKSEVGDIWYFGAQRQERLSRKWEAIRWYQRAALIGKYENRFDCALSVLRLVKEIADEKSLKRMEKTEVYQRLGSASKWYIEHFRETEQRPLAELLLLEAYFRSRKLKEARGYLSEVIQKEGFSESHKNQFLTHNRRLYRSKQWDEAYFLSKEVADRSTEAHRKKSPDFYKKMRKLEQESAFQQAFLYEKGEKKGKEKRDSLENARNWYLNAIRTNQEREVTLKAWNNLILSYRFPEEGLLFEEKMAEFYQSYRPRPTQDRAENELLRAIHLRSVQLGEKMGRPDKKAEALVRALPYVKKKKEKEFLEWEAAILYGSLGDVDQVNEIVRGLEKRRASLLKKRENQAVLARLYFWNGEYKTAWERLLPVLTSERVSPTAWILVRDLFFRGFQEDKTIYREVREYLVSNRRRLKSVSILQGIWAGVLYPGFDKKKLVEIQAISNRKPAVSQNGTQLKKRVELVSQVLKNYGEARSRLKPFVESEVLQVSIAALCAAPKLSENASIQLASLKVPSIRSPQWPEFLKKLKKKVGQLKSTAKRERANCENQQKNLAFLPSIGGSGESPLCDQRMCFPRGLRDRDRLLELEREQSRSERVSLNQIYEYLKLGAWAVAEGHAFRTKNKAKRSLYLGFIRLAIGDSWNAAPLLAEASRSKLVREHAKLLLARAAWRNDRLKEAKRELASVRDAKLSDWEKPLFRELVEFFRATE